MTNTNLTTTPPTTLPAGNWIIDPAHSEVGFTVRHLGLSKVRGRFTTFAGTLTAAEELGDASVAASIDLASVNTSNEQRDSHLLGSDFFDVENDTQMTFRSTSILANGTEGTVSGELTIGGITRTIDLDVEFNGVAVDAYGVTRAGLSASTTLSRKEFGIDFNVPLDAGGILIGDKVTVELEIQFVPAEG